MTITHINATHKDVIHALMRYGSKSVPTIREVAQFAGVAGASIRVYLTDPLFQKTYYAEVWNRADAFIYGILRADLGKSDVLDEMIMETRLLRFSEYGTLLQHAILWRLLVDLLHLSTIHPPFRDRLDMYNQLRRLSRVWPGPVTFSRSIEIFPLSLVCTNFIKRFIWEATDVLHSSRANNIQQVQHHIMVKSFIGIKLLDGQFVSNTQGLKRLERDFYEVAGG